MTSLDPAKGSAKTTADRDEITLAEDELAVEGVELADFLEGAGALSLADRKRLVDQALVLLEQNYVHLPLKRAMHAVEPVQALRLLRHRLESTAADAVTPEIDFHRQMLTVFTSVRDLHTNYLLPAPFSRAVALMPFDIESYFADGQRRYAVSHTAPGFQDEHFGVGVEVTHWNGMPIDRAVAANAERYAGSNLEARRARGIEFLTRRPLRTGLPPDEHWVTITYVDGQGIERELRQSWRVEGIPRRPEGIDPAAITTAATALGMDLELDMSQRVKRRLFAPRADAVSAELSADEEDRQAGPGEQLATTMPEYFRARSVVTAHGTFGHVRIFSFNIGDPSRFVGEFLRLIELLPQNGLIIDVRGNGGGHIHASEGLLQLLTPRAVEPEPTQFINTALNLRLCRRHRNNPVGLDLGGWIQSMEQAVQTGATYSRGVPITPADWANAIGQRYYGPVVLITDALCYSATDIFAAGFQDHGIGPVLGIDGNTGAGGANVWTHDLLRELFRQPPPPDAESPYEPLPGGAGMRVSIRRMLRVGDESGTPLEDLGVVPDHRHRMTLDDILGGNPDLLDRAGELLAGLPVRRLDARLTHGEGNAVLDVATAALDRLDLLVDGRPFASFDVTDGSRLVDIDRSVTASVELRGFADGEMVACRRIPA